MGAINENYPAWMTRVLELIDSGENLEPIAKFDTQEIAARERLRFYRFLKAEKARGNLKADGVILQWTSTFDSGKSKVILKFSRPREVDPLVDSSSDVAERAEIDRLMREMAKKYGGK